MKSTFLFFFLFFSLLSLAQNSGQSSENNALKLTQEGTNVRVLNKQPCTADVRIDVEGRPEIAVSIASGGTYLITLSQGIHKVRAKAEKKCPGYNADMGWVELTTNGGALPLTLKSFTIWASGYREFKGEIEVLENTGIREVQIRRIIGNRMVNVLLISPQDLIPGQKYSFTFKLD